MIGDGIFVKVLLAWLAFDNVCELHSSCFNNTNSTLLSSFFSYITFCNDINLITLMNTMLSLCTTAKMKKAISPLIPIYTCKKYPSIFRVCLCICFCRARVCFEFLSAFPRRRNYYPRVFCLKCSTSINDVVEKLKKKKIYISKASKVQSSATIWKSLQHLHRRLLQLFHSHKLSITCALSACKRLSFGAFFPDDLCIKRTLLSDNLRLTKSPETCPRDDDSYDPRNLAEDY